MNTINGYIVASQTYGVLPLEVSFSFIATSGEARYLRWDFGDGTYNSSVATHTYTNPGTYKVVLTAYDMYENPSVIYNFEYEEALIQVIGLSFTADKIRGSEPLLVNFRIEEYRPTGIGYIGYTGIQGDTGGATGIGVTGIGATGVVGVTGLPIYHWDFGDGSPNSIQRNPSHIYLRPGSYNVGLTVNYDRI